MESNHFQNQTDKIIINGTPVNKMTNSELLTYMGCCAEWLLENTTCNKDFYVILTEETIRRELLNRYNDVNGTNIPFFDEDDEITEVLELTEEETKNLKY